MTMTSFKEAFPLALRIEELEKILKSLRKIEDVTLVQIGDAETSMIVINDDITCELIYKTAIALVEKQIDNLKAPLKKILGDLLDEEAQEKPLPDCHRKSGIR